MGRGVMNAVAMAEGRRRAQERRQREAIKKVRAFKAWCSAGGDFRTMPEVPKDAEFRMARRARLA